MKLHYILLFSCFSYIYTPTPRRGRVVYCFTFVRPSVLPRFLFVAFFSVTVDGRNLIFGHKLHIGTTYRGKRFWNHQIPTSCLPILLIFIHIFQARTILLYRLSVHVPKVCILSKYLGSDVIMSFDWREAIISIQ